MTPPYDSGAPGVEGRHLTIHASNPGEGLARPLCCGRLVPTRAVARSPGKSRASIYILSGRSQNRDLGRAIHDAEDNREKGVKGSREKPDDDDDDGRILQRKLPLK